MAAKLFSKPGSIDAVGMDSDTLITVISEEYDQQHTQCVHSEIADDSDDEASVWRSSYTTTN